MLCLIAPSSLFDPRPLTLPPPPQYDVLVVISEEEGTRGIHQVCMSEQEGLRRKEEEEEVPWIHLFNYLRVQTFLTSSPPLLQIRVIRAFQSGLVEPLDVEEERKQPRGLGARWSKRLRPSSASENASLDILVDPEGGRSPSLPEVEGSR